LQPDPLDYQLAIAVNEFWGRELQQSSV